MDISVGFLFAAQLGAGFLAGAAWLVVSRLMRPVRKRPRLAYGMAAAVAAAASLGFPDGPILSGLIAGSIVAIVFYRQRKRALKMQSMEINTIISYEHQNYS